MDIFVINTSAADNINTELLEEFRHKEFKNKVKEKEHCFSYLIADRILREVYGLENRDLEFVNGKPYLRTREKFFSLSHSGEYVVLVFSGNECGVDIEQIKNRDYVSIAERMKFNVSTLNEFYSEWTKYEAEYKLGGRCKSIMQTPFENYMITAVSECSQETFEIYIQNGDSFSNL